MCPASLGEGGLSTLERYEAFALVNDHTKFSFFFLACALFVQKTPEKKQKIKQGISLKISCQWTSISFFRTNRFE